MKDDLVGEEQPNDTDDLAELVARLAAAEQALQDRLGVDDSAGHSRLLPLAAPELVAREALQRSTATTLAAILDALPAHIALLDSNSVVVATNQAWRRFGQEHGLREPYCVGTSYLEVCRTASGHAAAFGDATRASEGIRQVLAGELARFSFEYPCNTPGGELWFQMQVTAVSGTVTGAVVMHLEITESRAAAGEVERAAHRLAQVVEAQRELATNDVDGLFDDAASWAERLLGADAGVLAAVEGDALVYRSVSGRAKGSEGLRLSLEGSLAGLAVRTGETLRCDDTELDPRVDAAACRAFGVRSIAVSPLRDQSGIIGVLEAMGSTPRHFADADLRSLELLAESLGSRIERRRAAAALQHSEEQYRLLFEGNPQPMWVFDLGNLRFLAVNEAAVQHYGYSRDEFLRMTLLDIRPPGELADFEAHVRSLPPSGKRLGQWRHRKKDGSIIVVEVSSDAIEFDGRPARLVAVDDVTERGRHLAQLREQASLLDQAQDAIVVWDLSHRATFWNRSAERLFGWPRERAVGSSVRELIYLDEAAFDAAMVAVLENGEWFGEVSYREEGGKSVAVECRWTLVRDPEGIHAVLAVHTDITGRRSLEQQFLRSQRMESVGRLAGGIAHDLNNVLAPVLLSVELLRLEASEVERSRILDTIESSVRRGAALIKQVLGFARGVQGSRLPVDLAALIRELERILNDTFLKSIEVRCLIDTQLWPIIGDATQIHQVLLNLCVNARDAMPDGGFLTIAAGNIELDEVYAAAHLDAHPGQFVLIEVEDTGIGMSPTLLDTIFEPFFTTKEMGQGTGLGLPTSLAIVKSHGGFIRVYSELGRGTTFRVYLPASPQAVELEVEPAPRAPALGGGEVILVVDDEAPIRELSRRVLENAGYRVLLAADGAEAVALFSRQHQDIALVLTDMMMPVLDGPATIRGLQAIDPGVRVIAASGMASDGRVDGALASGVIRFLAKPYSPSLLLEAVRSALDGPEPGSNTGGHLSGSDDWPI